MQIFKAVFLFDLFTNRARKLKFAASNQANASLTKPWLATDEANLSFESNSPDLSRLFFFFNGRTAIAGAIIGFLLVFYNSKNMNCIGVLSFFKICSHICMIFEVNWSSDFGHTETGSGAKKRVVLRREIFSL